MTPLTFIVPMPENVTNARSGSGHWRTVLSRKRAYLDSLDLLYLSRAWKSSAPGLFVTPDVPDAPLERATVRATLYLGHAMDDDNAIARCKPVVDWLVRRGYLVDDSRKHLRWEALPDQVVKRGQQYRIELTLSPLPETPEP